MGEDKGCKSYCIFMHVTSKKYQERAHQPEVLRQSQILWSGAKWLPPDENSADWDIQYIKKKNADWKPGKLMSLHFSICPDFCAKAFEAFLCQVL